MFRWLSGLLALVLLIALVSEAQAGRIFGRRRGGNCDTSGSNGCKIDSSAKTEKATGDELLQQAAFRGPITGVAPLASKVEPMRIDRQAALEFCAPSSDLVSPAERARVVFRPKPSAAQVVSR